MSHYHHQYLIALDGDFESAEEAGKRAQDLIYDYLEPHFERLYDGYEITGTVRAKDVGPEEFLARIREALARRDETVQSYLAEIKKAYPNGIPAEALTGGFTMAGWYMYRLLSLFKMDMVVQESMFYDFAAYTNCLTPEREADIREHPERYALVSVIIHY